MKSKLLVAMGLIAFLLVGTLSANGQGGGKSNPQVIKKGFIAKVVDGPETNKPYFVLKVDNAYQYLRPDSVPNWFIGKVPFKNPSKAEFQGQDVELIYNVNLEAQYSKVTSFGQAYKLDTIKIISPPK